MPTAIASAPAEPLPTVVTWRSRLPVAAAAASLDEGLQDAVGLLVRLINRIISAAIVNLEGFSPSLLSEVDGTSFSTMTFLLKGRGPAFRHGQYSTNLHRTVLNTTNLPGDAAQSFAAATREAVSTSDVALLLNRARGLLAGGMPRQALLQLAIACETATRLYVHGALAAAGASPGRLRRQDLSFNAMLHLLLRPLLPDGIVLTPDQIGQIDSIRKQRNALMHEGTAAPCHSATKRAYEHARDFIAALRRASAARGLPPI